MRACIVRVLFVFFVIMLYASPAARAEEPQLPTNGPLPLGPLPPSSVWVVVNLFGGQTSKQAVIVRATLERLGAEGHGIIMPYRDVTVENMLRLRPLFLALSPNGTPWCKYNGPHGAAMQHFLKSLRIIVEDMQIPVVGICGGHQALALAFGGKVGPILGGENDCFPYRKPPTERGRHTVQVVRSDPLFLGMGQTLNLVENHFDEVKRLPKGFICLAANSLCPYQIIRHPTRPAYGIQAHTEYYLGTKPDGGSLLRNFLYIARIHNRLVRSTDGIRNKSTSVTSTSPSAPTLVR
jgi:GMP synthase (glutamine-hydrolysing)